MNTVVVNLRTEPYDVLVCRPSKWGNPFPIEGRVTREKALAMYEVHVRRNPKLIAARINTIWHECEELGWWDAGDEAEEACEALSEQWRQIWAAEIEPLAPRKKPARKPRKKK
jgi:hypothetical protein